MNIANCRLYPLVGGLLLVVGCSPAPRTSVVKQATRTADDTVVSVSEMLRQGADIDAWRRLMLLPRAQVVRLTTFGNRVSEIELLVNGQQQFLRPSLLSPDCTVVLAASTIGLLRTTDLGLNWNTFGNAGVSFYSLASDPGTPATLYAGNTTGMGLGLSFVTTILEHFGATMAVESEPLRGATFRLSFPLSAS